MKREISKEAEARVRKEFERVLDDARPAYELYQLERFTVEDEAFIQQEVERLLYEPQMPNGGEAERRIIKRLKEMSDSNFWKNCEAVAMWVADDEKKKSVAWLCDKAAAAVHKWAAVLPDNPRHAGRYYVRHPLTQRYNKMEYAWFDHLKNYANTTKDWDAKWFAELMLQGPPEPISDFKMDCLFVLTKPEGGIDRLVRLENIKGEIAHGSFPNGCELLEAVNFAAPEKFRTWLLNLGRLTFSGNQTHLQMIQEDINRLSQGRDVLRIHSCGWHFLEDGVPGNQGFVVQKGLWFFDDCAIAPKGMIITPDEDGVIWFEGKGYYLMPTGREVPFQLGRPKMHPGRGILNCNLSIEGWANQPQGETEEDRLRAFFRELCQRTYENFGIYDVWLSLGHVFSYCAAPELFQQQRIFPGGLAHGMSGSGKNKLVEWEVAIFGFIINSGIGFNSVSTTAVGLMMAAENYSNLPVAIDEFGKGEIDQYKLAVLHNAANRQMESKWTADGGKQRTFKTSFLVGGECTAQDSAFRSRYLLVQATAELRTCYLAYWDALKKRNPKLLFDSCASGGRRLDLETMRRSVSRTRSDYLFEPIGEQCHTYGLAFWLPYSGSGYIDEVTDQEPNNRFYGALDSDPDEFYFFRSGLNPSMTWCSDVRRDDLHYETLVQLFDEWKEVSPYLLGNYYPLTPYSTNKDAWMAWQFDQPELNGGTVFVFRRDDCPEESINLKVQGLDPSAKYDLKNFDSPGTINYTGSDLMEKGLDVAITKKPGAIVFVYKKE